MVEPPVWAIGFFDDMPAGESVDTIYDASDLIRGVEAFLTAVPGASQVLCVAVLAHWVSRRRRRLGMTIGYSDPRERAWSGADSEHETTYGTTFGA